MQVESGAAVDVAVGPAGRNGPVPTERSPAARAAHACVSFGDGLRRFFLRRGVPRDDVDDLIQDVYLRLLRQCDAPHVRYEQAFVYTTAMNLLRDRYRRNVARGTVESLHDSGEDIAAEGFDPERSAECTQHLHEVVRTVRRLKPATREVFLGHRLSGLSYADLARELGVSISMIEKHMIAALAALGPVARECTV